MLGVMRRASVLALLGLAVCVEGPAPDLALDMGRACQTIALEVRDPAILPGSEVHAMALERTDGDSAWILATDGEGLLRLRGWPQGPSIDLSDLGAAHEFRLVPGPGDGQTWLVLDRPGVVQVWRLEEAAEGTMFAGPVLSNFPAEGDWTRRLVFIDEVPHLMSVPDAGDASTVELSLARLSLETLEPDIPIALPLWQTTCIDDGVEETGPSCEAPLLSGPVTLELLDTAEAGSLNGAAALIAMYAAKTSDPPMMTALHTTLVASVELRTLGPEAPPTMIRRDWPIWFTNGPVYVSLAFITADTRKLYWIAGYTPFDGPPPEKDLVIRANRDEEGSAEGVYTVATVDRGRNTHLLQIGGRAALGQVNDDVWTIAPIRNDAIDQTTIAKLQLEPNAEVSLAGRGQFLVRGDKGTRRVAAICADDPTPE